MGAEKKSLFEEIVLFILSLICLWALDGMFSFFTFGIGGKIPLLNRILLIWILRPLMFSVVCYIMIVINKVYLAFFIPISYSIFQAELIVLYLPGLFISLLFTLIYYLAYTKRLTFKFFTIYKKQT